MTLSLLALLFIYNKYIKNDVMTIRSVFICFLSFNLKQYETNRNKFGLAYSNKKG